MSFLTSVLLGVPEGGKSPGVFESMSLRKSRCDGERNLSSGSVSFFRMIPSATKNSVFLCLNVKGVSTEKNPLPRGLHMKLNTATGPSPMFPLETNRVLLGR